MKKIVAITAVVSFLTATAAFATEAPVKAPEQTAATASVVSHKLTQKTEVTGKSVSAKKHTVGKTEVKTPKAAVKVAVKKVEKTA